MPKHKPIKFKTTLEPSLIKQVKEIMQENKKAKTVLNATLALMAMGGILTLGIVAPGVLGELSKMACRRRREKHEQYRKIWQRFHLLRQRGNLEFVEEKDGYSVYQFSQKGKEKIKKLIFDEFSIKKPRNWDGKWRLVIFDIPEHQKKARWALRRKLKGLGFYQCQKSVWIHPFPCFEEIEFLKNILDIKPFVKLFLVDEMTDGKVLYHFHNQIKEIMAK